MKIFTRMPVAVLAAIACGLVGCFSYHKEVRPAPVVEESTPPASTTTSSTTTTDQDGYLKKQTTTTYSNP
jgi:hypothetical protein